MTANKHYPHLPSFLEPQKAGKESILYSNPDGINLFTKKRKRLGITHDDSHVPGWNNKP